MEKLVKTCKLHGELNENDIIKKKNSHYRLGYTLRCRKCVHERTWREGLKCKVHGKLSKEDVRDNGICKKCPDQPDYWNWRRNNNREWFNEKLNEDKKKNPEKWKERGKRWYQLKLKRLGPDIVINEIIRVHNLTRDQYDKMHSDQKNVCKICLQPETRRVKNSEKIMRLVVDHCHETKKVRGLLCHNCNTGLGKFKDDVELLEMAILYLQDNEEVPS